MELSTNEKSEPLSTSAAKVTDCSSGLHRVAETMRREGEAMSEAFSSTKLGRD